jgi:hypothetical protein
MVRTDVAAGYFKILRQHLPRAEVNKTKISWTQSLFKPQMFRKPVLFPSSGDKITKEFKVSGYDLLYPVPPQKKKIEPVSETPLFEKRRGWTMPRI